MTEDNTVAVDSATAMNDALASNYLLVDLRLRSWSGKRTDRGASDELLTSKQSVRDGGAFVKNLLASAGQELKEVHAAGNVLRSFVYARTLPWSSSSDSGAMRGERLLASSKAMEFLVELNSLKKEYDRSVMALVAVWPQRVAEAIRNLGALADDKDYPSSHELPGMFSVNVDLRPVPAISDFSRLNVPADLADALGQRAADLAEVQGANALRDLQGRLVDGLERVAKQLGKHGDGEKTRLYDSMITNLQGVVDLARHMNLNENPKLTELANKIESRLLTNPVAVYRDDVARSAAVAAEAKAMLVEASSEELFM